MTRAQVKCLARVSDWAVKSGNLTGLLITGLTPRGGELIENYVKRSGDVQTAALLGVRKSTRFQFRNLSNFSIGHSAAQGLRGRARLEVARHVQGLDGHMVHAHSGDLRLLRLVARVRLLTRRAGKTPALCHLVLIFQFVLLISRHLQRCELDVAITASTPAATKSAIVAAPQCVWRCSFCNHPIPQVRQMAEAGAAPKVSGLRGRIQGASACCYSSVVFAPGRFPRR